MRARRNLVAACGLAAVIGGAAPELASAASPLADSFSQPLSGWTKKGKVKVKRSPLRRDHVLRVSAVRKKRDRLDKKAGRPRKEGGRVARALPERRFVLSLDLALAPESKVAIGFGPTRHRLRLSRPRRGAKTFVAGSRPVAVRPAANPRGGKWVHLQAVASATRVRGAIGGNRFSIRRRPGAKLTIVLPAGKVLLDDLLVTPLSDPALLPLHRLADLHARLPRGRFIVGADSSDRLMLRSRYWTRGFLAGALWNASALTPDSDLFTRWALERTVDTFGYESADSHDVGMIYENSSLAALPTVCGTGPLGNPRLCARMRGSALVAARQLVALADSNAPAGTIPTRLGVPPAEADTIVDSAMNVPLLYWASRETGDMRFREVASRHARRLVETHVRPNGSTLQSVHTDRQTGEVLFNHTHQGIGPTSVWARGQGWAVYGFTASADELRDPKLLAAAERTASWVADHLPPSGVPRYDYDAAPGLPSDTSAGAITAAGLFRLASLCRRWTGACAQSPDRWRQLAERMLFGAFVQVSRSVPIGFFGGQVGTFGDSRLWDDGAAELIYGLSYGLEAIVANRREPQAGAGRTIRHDQQ